MRILHLVMAIHPEGQQKALDKKHSEAWKDIINAEVGGVRTADASEELRKTMSASGVSRASVKASVVAITSRSLR